MTKFAILSDLHLEFMSLDLQLDPDTDAFICAGDVMPGPNCIDAFLDIQIPMFFVPGNHDFYHKMPMDKLVDTWKNKAKGTNVTVLDNDIASINDVTIIGTTLWTNMRYRANNDIDFTRNLFVANASLADFSLINMPDNKVMRAIDQVALFNEAIEFLGNNINQQNGKLMVVTHHAPSILAQHPNFINSNLNHCFQSELDDWIKTKIAKESAPDVWIFGHTHWDVDTTIESMRLISSQRGYARINKYNNKLEQEKTWAVKYIEL